MQSDVIQTKNIKLLNSTLLSNFSTIKAVFTTRHGGISKAPYHTANLAFHVGDNPQHVLANHDLLATQLDYNRNNLIHMRQIHSDIIFLVDEKMNFDTPPECDALITNKIDVPLMIMSADCTPILIYDPLHHAIGVVHAGRKGALNAILPKTIQAMHTEFESIIEKLFVILGPSIHGCCYEVNEMIAKECENKGYSNALIRKESKVFLDVNTILLMQLQTLNISNIEVIEECTACKHDEYFSYRADAQKTGRIAGIIVLQ